MSHQLLGLSERETLCTSSLYPRGSAQWMAPIKDWRFWANQKKEDTPKCFVLLVVVVVVSVHSQISILSRSDL